jgi:biotin synthase
MSTGDAELVHRGSRGGSVKAEGLGDGCPMRERNHRQAALDAATRSNPRFEALLDRMYAAAMPALADIEAVLRIEEPEELQSLFDFAEAVRRQFVGDGVLLRGIIEFSNVCRNTCLYCGLNRGNRRLPRYRLTREQIRAAAEQIRAAGIKTVVLQSGEEDDLDADWLSEIIARIKSSLDLAVTLCVGERSYAEYQLWRAAGADRYLLKIETSDPDLYGQLHPGMSFANRRRCLQDLAELGYQTGSGDLVGLRGQTVTHLARDVQFFKEGNFDMISVGPFIPHPETPLAQEPAGDLWMTLKMTALARIVSRNAHIPATTAIGSLHGRDERPKALAAGANVLMPNFTPAPYRRHYEIYPNKRCMSEDLGACPACMELMVAGIGRWIDYSRGDSLKNAGCAPHTINL